MESLVLVVQIACGGMHTVALTADNKIIAWGVNDNCALGRDATWDEKLRDMDAESGEEEDGELNPLESTPTQVASRHLAADAVFVQVATGDSCSFALTETGLVYGWGTFRDSKGDERFGYEADGKMITKQDKPSLIQGVQDITQLACGVEHVLALDTRGNIWGWGNNEQNQLGRRLFGRDQDSLIPHQIRKDNVWGWGLNSFGEAGDPDTAGTNSAVLPECFVWGRMDGGQLGFTFTPEQLQDAAQLGLNSEEDVEVAQRVKGRDADEAVLTWSGAGGQFSVISAPATLG
ncbi:Protein pim1 like protein [Verticillium longisporum]|nr:Protein pim1 like protein [Verticillium longisporum]